MNWQEVCESPYLKDLPFKIELNEWGNIVMSPASTRHSILQGLIQDGLRQSRQEGAVFPEAPIQTAKGVKVPDVAWASPAFMRENRLASPFLRAPELCIEVMSPSNSRREMEEKRELYFARGALEVWLCDEQGQLSFYDCAGEIPASRLFPGITRIESEYLH